MPNTALKIESVSKLYRLGVISTGTLSHDLNRWWHMVRGKEDPYQKVAEANVQSARGESDYVWALKDVSFDVQHGEAIGIIGKNGAGKSTLLKILSRVTSLTKGEIKINGRIASLLEVGTGFHPELTGRENIFLNGAILGMKKHEIRRKLDEIIAFAGVEKYVDTPVKRYSSGMKVRLAFAVAAHLEPEILVVDEVLAVGDAEFRKKAIGKMQDVSQSEGRTVLFVSHNMASVKALCSKGVLLQNGKLSYSGDIDSVIENYIETGESIETCQLSKRKDRKGDGDALFTKIELFSNNKRTNQIRVGDEALFKINILCKKQIKNANIILSIYNNSGICLTKTTTDLTSKKSFILSEGENTVSCYFKSLPFQVGKYRINLALSDTNTCCDFVEYAFSFFVIEDDIYKTGKFDTKSIALLFLQNEWQLE